MGNNTRPRGAMAAVLDQDVLVRYARARGADGLTREALAHLAPFGGVQMLIAVNHGEIAVVNSEGVGTIATDELEATVGVYFELGMDTVCIDLTTDEIADATTDEAVDLADGIRTFGIRLDANHARWFSIYDHTA